MNSSVSFNSLDILYQDSDLVAVNKPSGIMVHNSKISEDTIFVLQLLREQLGMHIHPLHRLDRPTSGVLLFALHPEAARYYCKLFAEKSIQKRYLCLVRGHAPKNFESERPLQNESKTEMMPAHTTFSTLAHFTIPLPNKRFDSTRISLVHAFPHTGRTHQIRRHLKHLNHPILFDRLHGDTQLNHLLKTWFDHEGLPLHANQLQCLLQNGDPLTINAPTPNPFQKLLDKLAGFRI